MMHLVLTVCDVYQKEIEHVLFTRQIADVAVCVRACNCLQCTGTCFSFEASAGATQTVDVSDRQAGTLSTGRMQDMDASFSMCQRALVPKGVLDFFTEKGFFVATSGWMMRWKEFIQVRWGFTEETAKAFFAEHLSHVLLMDSCVYGDLSAHVDAFSSFTGAAVETMTVGTGHLEQTVLRARDEYLLQTKTREVDDLTRQLSDYRMMMDVMPRLNAVESVENVIREALGIFVLLTAAAHAAFLPIAGNKGSAILYHNDIVYPTRLSEFASDAGSMETLTSSAQNAGLHVISYNHHVLGLLDITTFLFDQYRESYEELIEAMSGIFALALSNADHYHNLLLAKDQLQKEYENRKHLFNTITHELRTPLNGIMGYLQLMSPAEAETENGAYIQNALAASSMLLSLVNDLLNQAQMEAGKFSIQNEPFAITRMMEESVSLVAPAAQINGIRLSISLPDLLRDAFMGDALRIGQIVTNLLSNAVKFTHQGTVQLHVSTMENLLGQTLLFVDVSDTGSGMGQDLLENLFKPFVQAEHAKSRGGTGLGLSISKQLAGQMAGILYATSIPGVGSTFSLRLVLEPAP